MDITVWLRSLGLEQYAPAFRDNDIEAEMLPQLTAEDLMALAHGGHFVLMDGQRRIRGYYNSEDDDAVARLVHDATRLVEEESRGERW